MAFSFKLRWSTSNAEGDNFKNTFYHLARLINILKTASVEKVIAVLLNYIIFKCQNAILSSKSLSKHLCRWIGPGTRCFRLHFCTKKMILLSDEINLTFLFSWPDVQVLADYKTLVNWQYCFMQKNGSFLWWLLC